MTSQKDNFKFMSILEIQNPYSSVFFRETQPHIQVKITTCGREYCSPHDTFILSSKKKEPRLRIFALA